MYKTRAKRVCTPYWVLLMHINNHGVWPNDSYEKDNINITITTNIQNILTATVMSEHMQAAFTPNPVQKHVTPAFSQSPQCLSCSTFSPAELFLVAVRITPWLRITSPIYRTWTHCLELEQSHPTLWAQLCQPRHPLLYNSVRFNRSTGFLFYAALDLQILTSVSAR